MNKRSFKKLLKKYQTGQLDRAAARFIETWYDQIGLTAEADLMLNDEQKAAEVRNAIHSNLINYIGKKETARKLNPWPYLVAASVLLMLSLGIFLQQRDIYDSAVAKQVYTTVSTDPGILKKIELPDHSEIWLNSGSTLRYVAKTFVQKREVFLDEGEAFFTVVKNAKHPFSVRTSNLNTTVLGTSFNVRAYRKLAYASVQVKTGRVRVNVGQRVRTDTLTASQDLVYHKTSGKVTLNTNVQFPADGWTHGLIALNEATFEELSLVMYNRYQLILRSNNPAVHKYRYTINILQDKSIESILGLICATHQNKYRRNRNEVTIY